MRRRILTSAEMGLVEIKRKYPEVWIRERRMEAAMRHATTVRWVVYGLVVVALAVALNYK